MADERGDEPEPIPAATPELTVVVNPGAGADDGGLPDEVRAALGDARVVEVDDGDLMGALTEAARSPIVGIVGGDGSINATAEVALDHGRTVAVFPGGTLNHFARDLGIADAAASAAALAAGTTRVVDVGLIAGRPFLNTASLGSYPELVDERERREERMGKWPAMALAALIVMRRSDPVHLVINGRPIRTWAIFIGNCRYDPPGLAPRERRHLDDGVFDVRWIDARMRFSRTRVTLALCLGRFGRSIAVGRLVADRVEIHSLDGPLRLARDGESFGGDTVEVVIDKHPDGLRVVAPESGSRSVSGP